MSDSLRYFMQIESKINQDNYDAPPNESIKFRGLAAVVAAFRSYNARHYYNIWTAFVQKCRAMRTMRGVFERLFLCHTKRAIERWWIATRYRFQIRKVLGEGAAELTVLEQSESLLGLDADLLLDADKSLHSVRTIKQTPTKKHSFSHRKAASSRILFYFQPFSDCFHDDNSVLQHSNTTMAKHISFLNSFTHRFLKLNQLTYLVNFTRSNLCWCC